MKFSFLNAALMALAAAAPALAQEQVHFTDITARSGIHFRHNAGKAGQKFLPETMGSGVAVIDYNGDGKPDLFFVNSRDWHRDTDRRPVGHGGGGSGE